MNIDDLIHALQMARTKHGNIQVRAFPYPEIENDGCGPVNSVKYYEELCDDLPEHIEIAFDPDQPYVTD